MLLTVLATGPVMVRMKANATMACRPLLELSCGSTSRVAHRTLVEKASPRLSGGPTSEHTTAAFTGLTCSCSTNISSSKTLNKAPPETIIFTLLMMESDLSTEKSKKSLDDERGENALDAFAALPQFGAGKSAVCPLALMIERRLQLLLLELLDFLLQATSANEIHNPTHFELV